MNTPAGYTVEKVKTFIGNEGYGFNAELHYRGRKVAFVIDSADGGCYNWYWEDTETDRVEVNTITESGKPTRYQGTPEEKRLCDAIRDIPPETVMLGNTPVILLPHMDHVISSMIDNYLIAKGA